MRKMWVGLAITIVEGVIEKNLEKVKDERVRELLNIILDISIIVVRILTDDVKDNKLQFEEKKEEIFIGITDLSKLAFKLDNE